MSKSAHIQTRHIIEYGNSGFNGKQTELYRLLQDNGCTVNTESGDEYSDEWELQEDEFKEAVRKISRLSEKKIAGYGLDKTKDEILNALNGFLETGHNDGYFHLSWF